MPDYSQALQEDVKSLVLGIPRRYFFDPEHVHAETLAAVESAIQWLEGIGARARVAELPDMDLVTGLELPRHVRGICVPRGEGEEPAT